MGVGVRVGKGVEVGTRVGVGGRGGTSVVTRLSPMLTTTSRLIIQSMMRVCLTFERRTVPPVNGCYLAFHYSTAMRRHKRSIAHAYLKIVASLLTAPIFRCIMTVSQLMTVS